MKSINKNSKSVKHLEKFSFGACPPFDIF